MASALLRKMLSRGLKPTHAQFNAVLDAHARCSDGSASEALQVLADMNSSGYNPNMVSYSTCIDAQARREDGSAVSAAQLLVQLLEKNLCPDTATFAGVIEAQAKRTDGSAQTAALALSKMAQYTSPSQIHFNSVLNACANQRPADITTAEATFVKMLASGHTPNMYTLSALLRSAGFAETPCPGLARKWFEAYCVAPASRSFPLVEVNDHIARALRLSLAKTEVDTLLDGTPFARAPPSGARRRHHSTTSPETSPPTMPRRLSRQASPRMTQQQQQQQHALDNWRTSGNWRSKDAPISRHGGSGGSVSCPGTPLQASSSFFASPLTQQQQDWGEKPPTPSAAMLDIPSAMPQPSSPSIRIPARGGSARARGRSLSSSSSSTARSPPLGHASRNQAAVPSDRPVHSQGRRASSNFPHTAGPRRAGSDSVFGAHTTHPAPSGVLQEARIAFTGPGTGERLTLALKIQQLKAANSSSSSSSSGAPVQHDASAGRAPLDDGRACRAPLLSPDFFRSCSGIHTTTVTQPQTRRHSSSSAVLRDPSGPDGTRGFGRRRSSILLASNLDACAAVVVG